MLSFEAKCAPDMSYCSRTPMGGTCLSSATELIAEQQGLSLSQTQHICESGSHIPIQDGAKRHRKTNQAAGICSGVRTAARRPEPTPVPHVQPVFGEHLAGTSVTVSHSWKLRSSQQQQCKACELWWRGLWLTTEQFVSTVSQCAQKISHNQVPPIYNYLLLCF